MNPKKDNLATVRLYAWGMLTWGELTKPQKNKRLKELNNALNSHGYILRTHFVMGSYPFGSAHWVSPSTRPLDQDEFLLLHKKRPGQPRGMKKRFILRESMKGVCRRAIELLDGVSFNEDAKNV